ncbi:sterol desaturase family protein [Qipengyuania seohaensis]|uniref:sterol desaturase family protein n=1 Tax=Qipengyuania seohaensis TaxID=266951 RepID=UPI000C22D349|nr:sterol desaturase family protein [Qipengyuania seohaensis]
MNEFHFISLGLFAAFAVLERASKGRTFPTVKRWRIKGAAFAVLYFAIATFAPLMWDEALGAHQLVDASTLHFGAQVAIGFLVLQFGVYWWHRTMHRSDTLWRLFHQMHHSAERVDIWGAFYFHPLDMLGWAFLGSLVLVLGVGLTGEAAFIVAVLATFCSMFQHSNLKTPHWLGYLVTRPESHSVHHERGVHGFNYGDIPLFDMIFGTFRNPPVWNGEAGFYEGSSEETSKLLTFRKIA